MIFITVGTQLPFDRLLEYFAEWQKQDGYSGKVVAQVGKGSQFENSSIELIETLTSDQYYKLFIQADGIVSHAGMGSILSCLDYAKKGVFLSRQYALGEHRNDHQLDTASAFKDKYPTLTFCTDKKMFFEAMNKLMTNEGVLSSSAAPQHKNELGQNIAAYFGLNGR